LSAASQDHEETESRLANGVKVKTSCGWKLEPKGIASSGLLKFGMDNRPNIEGLLFRIVTALVDDPAEVRVASAKTATGTVLQVVVARGDQGKVIGKAGRTARSLRELLYAMGVAAKTRYQLDIDTTS
jgi:uncharacterized protein